MRLRHPAWTDFLKQELAAATKSADKEMTKIQTFVLDAVAPLTATMLEAEETLNKEEALTAAGTALELLGNANARISRLRHEKVMQDLNKVLQPLEKQDASCAPALFNPEFAKKSKEHVEQVKAMMRAATAPRRDKPFFSSPPPPPQQGGTKNYSWSNGYNQHRRRGGGPRTLSRGGGVPDIPPEENPYDQGEQGVISIKR